MITDERLKDIVSGKGCYGYKDSETMDMASELLEAHRKIALLKEDAERLAEALNGYKYFDMNTERFWQYDREDVIDRHNQVMKEVE